MHDAITSPELCSRWGKDLKWLPLEYRIEYHQVLFAYKAINNQLPRNISNLFTLCKDINTHNLRSNSTNNIYQPNLSNKSCVLRVTKAWNDLSTTLKMSPSVSGAHLPLETIKNFNMCIFCSVCQLVVSKRKSSLLMPRINRMFNLSKHNI